MTLVHPSVADPTFTRSPTTTVVGRVPVFSDTEGNLSDSGMLISEIGLLPAFGPRLSLVQGVPVPIADVVASTRIYVEPSVLGGNLVVLPTATGKVGIYYSSISIQLTTTRNQASSAYDVWMGISGGNVVAGTGPAWSNASAGSSTRGVGANTTEIELWQGLWVNKNQITVWNGTNSYSFPARTALLIGSFRTTANAGEATDTKLERWVSSLFAPVYRVLERSDPAIQWFYSLANWRIANNNNQNQVSIFQCMAGRDITLEVGSGFSNNAATYQLGSVGISKNSLTVNSAQILLPAAANNSLISTSKASFSETCDLGLTGYAWLEYGAGSDTQTWRGNPFPGMKSGLLGRVLQ